MGELSLERKIYLGILTIYGAISTWIIYQESKELIDGKKSDRMLGTGWSILGIKRDIANFEWTFWFSDLRESILFSLVSYISISCLFANYLPWAKDVATSLFCVYCVNAALGEEFVVIVILYSLCYYAIMSIFKSEQASWILTILSLLTLHFDSAYMEILQSILGKSLSYLGYSAMGFTVLRCSSFFCERLQAAATEKSNFTVMTLLRYNFYLPYFFFGPIMTFDVFCKKQQKKTERNEVFELIMEGLKIAAMIMIVDFLLHFIHVSSIALDLKYLQKAPSFVVGFILFCNVFLDWMKAAVLYNVTLGIARVVDGYEEAPTGPKCIATVCTFADTYFDRGIQHWVSRYCYDRIGGNHTNLSKETIASMVTFLVVTIWQGPGVNVIVWAVLNCLGLTFEFFIFRMTPSTDKKYKRTVAIFLGLNYWCILLFNVVGINGIDTAFIAFQSLFVEGNIFNLCMTIALGYFYAAAISLKPEKEKQI